MYDFKAVEEKIRKFWDEHRIFQKTLEQTRSGKRFVFFEGPPTANGRPHMGSLETRVFKDVFLRYKTMRGFFVLRKAGWDTHGLPVELEIEKELGFKNKKDIEAYGIAKFNRKARQSVWKYKKEWEDMTRRVGFWLDFDRPYITYETSYIESVWNILKEVWKKGLLYQAHKVVPFCTRCGTPLSSHEVAQGYKLVTERSVTVKFKVQNAKLKILEGETVFILAWTTTPWTLPGNVGLAVGRDIDYAVVEANGDNFIIAKDLVEKVFGPTPYALHSTLCRGSDLVGLSYKPLFDVPQLQNENSHKVYAADFVSTQEGTGVVHTAVMYGEDDYVLGTAVGLPKVHTVTVEGRFTGVSKELDGRYVKAKETEDTIVDDLKRRNLLFREENYTHDYPYCWRCSTPLIYYAKDSWFIKMSAVRDQLLANNEKINWVPAHLKDGRFGQWLKEGKDWALSRERYWGTPLPVWKCVKCGEVRIVGSVDELEKRAQGRKNMYYLVRHGGSTRDEEGNFLLNSRLESDTYPLTERGRQGAEQAAQHILSMTERVDILFTSPFTRTKETAEIIGRAFHVEARVDERLREILDSPICEGKPKTVCDSVKERGTFSDRAGGTESWDDVRLRLMTFMREVETQYKGKRIVIVGHGDPLWLLHGMMEGRSEQEILERKQTGETHWYPKLAEVKQMAWRTIPRNEYGELDLHRPFIDEVSMKCPACRAAMKKIPDLIDVWFDSGSMPYAQWHWPFEGKEMFKKQFPADFITEGVDMTRGWFYTLLAVSTLLGKGAPYKNVLSFGLTLDEKGQKMSKSKGNGVYPDEVLDAVGADATRWFFYTLNQPGEPKLFSMNDVRQRLTGFIGTLENCVKFWELYQVTNSEQRIANSGGIVADSKNPKVKEPIDKWILSRWRRTLKIATEAMDVYDPTTAARALEQYTVDDLSKWWLRRSRKRPEALPLLRMLLLELDKTIAPFVPFIAEDMHMRLHVGAQPGSESVHLHAWPKVQKKFIKDKLEAEMQAVRDVISAGLAIRKEKNIRVRQPLKVMTLKEKPSHSLLPYILGEVNVKSIKVDKAQEARVVLGTELSPALVGEGFAREVMRAIQDMRKDVGYRFDQKVRCQWHADDSDVARAMEQWSDAIKTDTILSEFVRKPKGNDMFDVEKEFELAPGKKIWVGIKK